MACTQDMILEAAACASEFKLISFTATPANSLPGQPVTLRWNINKTGNCTGRIKLNGITVPMDGSRVVNPLSDITYSLVVSTRCNVSRTLGRVRIDVNDSSCRLIPIPESAVRSQVISAVDSKIQEFNQTSSNDLSKRSETKVEVDPSGISIKVRLKAAINNFPDPDLNVDMKIGVGVGPGNTVVVFYKSFSVDVDWPWWVTAITLGITAIVEHIVENIIEDKIKNGILDALKTQINAVTSQIPGTLAGIETLQDEVRIKIC